MRRLILALMLLVPSSVRAEFSVNDFAATVVEDEVIYTAKVCGQLQAPQVGIYYDRAAAPTHTDQPDETKSLSGELSCLQDNVSFVRSGTPIGLYNSWIFADPQDAVSENNENDNLAGPLEVCVGPDIVIEQWEVVTIGAAVTYSATVCNNGSMQGIKFRVGFWHDLASAPAPEAMGHIFFPFAVLDAGECEDIEVAGGLRPNGSFTAWARADSGDFIEECREGNNPQGPKPYSLSNPDLDLVTFEAKVEGSTVTYTTKICNKGTAAVSKFFVDVYYHRPEQSPIFGEPGDEAKPVQSLEPDACTTLTFTRSGTPKGSFISYGFADPDDFVSEPNEGNNLSDPLQVQVGGGGGGEPDGPPPLGEDCEDTDGDGYGAGIGCQGVPDCDDSDAAISPGVSETCGDQQDQDCDLTPDDDCPGIQCTDGDGDGFGVGPDCVLADCDDESKEIYPWAPETCGDNKDDNCNAIADDGCSGRQCVDQDADGSGVGKGCPGPQDCDDTDHKIKPGATDICGDGVDNDCDNAVDDDDGCTSSMDNDQDGASVGGGAEGQPDCDDGNPSIGPGQQETCGDGVDNDCDGTVDDGCEGVQTTDDDGDSWGVGKDAAIPDCDDTDPSIHPWAEEVCGDDVDNDCDGTIDDNCPGVDCVDTDGDSWGVGQDCCNDTASSGILCKEDCDDNDGGRNQWAAEICADGMDNNCDTVIDEDCVLCEDKDQDGHGIGPKCTSWDCDDSDPDTYPGATEACNGVDNDCNGTVDDDCGEAEGCGCHVPSTSPLVPLLWMTLVLILVVCVRRRLRSR